MNRSARIVSAPVLLALLATLGCASSDYMRTASGPVGAPAADTATVVFLRPSGGATAIRTTILDIEGRFIGDTLSSSYFAANVPPGEHVFFAWAENTSALRATLAPGKTYYVKVSPRMGVLSARMQLLAIKPGSEDWAKLKGWMGKKHLEPDTAKGQAFLDGRKDDVAKRIVRANAILKEYDAKDLAERTLLEQDGQ
jgi:hypothetical protein